jgi:ribose 5-phosphate isomerase B
LKRGVWRQTAAYCEVFLEATNEDSISMLPTFALISSPRPQSYLLDLKNEVKSHLEANGGYQVEDFGTDTYFDAAGKVAEAVATAETSDGKSSPVGILVCGTGMGVGMVANKFAGVRAATVENVVATRNARAVNDANVLCLGQLVTPPDKAKEITDAFFDQEFISQPPKAEWWNSDVEAFLSKSKEGIARVEHNAALIATKEEAK